MTKKIKSYIGANVFVEPSMSSIKNSVIASAFCRPGRYYELDPIRIKPPNTPSYTGGVCPS
jgi:hypothetical protein